MNPFQKILFKVAIFLLWILKINKSESIPVMHFNPSDQNYFGFIKSCLRTSIITIVTQIK